MKRFTLSVLLLLCLLGISLAETQNDGTTETNPTTETDTAAETNTETNPTAETDTPAESNTATETNPTTETNTAEQTHPAAESNAPAESNTPAETNTGEEANTAPETNSAEQPNTATETTTPEETNTTAEANTPTETNAAEETNTPAETNTSAETHPAAQTTTTTTPEAQTTSPTTTTTASSSTSSNTPSTVWAGLVLPQVRVNSTFDDPHDIICGGTVRDKVHYITTNQKMNEFKWYIETPSPAGRCLFRISENIDQNNDSAYVNLMPYGRPEVSEDGSFPCGRVAGADLAYYDIPDDIDCDSCILEWIWRAGDKVVRQCADITVTGGDDVSCIGQCQNGGICQRGVCVCPPGYTGTYCENAPGAIGRAARNILAIIFFILLAIIIILLIILLLWWCARKRIQEGEKEQIYQTNKKYMEFDVELPSQPQGVARPAELVRAESQSEY